MVVKIINGIWLNSCLVCALIKKKKSLKILYLAQGFLSSVRPSRLRHAQSTPPWIQNGLDWRALVQRLIFSIGKSKRILFYFFAK